MTSPSEPRSGEPEEPVSLDKERDKELDDDQPGTGQQSADVPFDPYRFGLPETLPPPEYAPPGWTPPANGPWAASPSAGPPGAAWAPPYAGGPAQHPYGGGSAAPHPGGQHPYPGAQSQQPGGQPPYAGSPGQQQYPSYPYGTSPYKTAPYKTATGSNGKAVAALVLGIISILMCWTSVLDAVLAIPAVVFGIVGLNEANRSGGTGKSMAIAGLVCGAVGAVLAIVITALLVHAVNQCGGFERSNLPGFQQCLQNHLTGSLQ